MTGLVSYNIELKYLFSAFSNYHRVLYLFQCFLFLNLITFFVTGVLGALFPLILGTPVQPKATFRRHQWISKHLWFELRTVRYPTQFHLKFTLKTHKTERNITNTVILIVLQYTVIYIQHDHNPKWEFKNKENNKLANTSKSKSAGNLSSQAKKPTNSITNNCPPKTLQKPSPSSNPCHRRSLCPTKCAQLGASQGHSSSDWFMLKF